MHPFLRDGIEQGMEKGRVEGRTEGLAEGLAPLVRVLERRLGRPVTGAERRQVAVRFEKDGPNVLGDVVLDLSPEQLAAWLAPRRTSKRTG